MKITLKTKQGRISFNPLVLSGLLASLFLIFSVFAAEKQETTTPMNASVSNIVSINLSADALDRGILFGSVTAGTNNNMAENDTTYPGNATDYYVGNAPSTTGNLNFWIKAPDMDRSGNPDYILIGNVTHEANQTAGGDNINMTITTDGTVALTTTYQKIGGAAKAPCDSVPAGSACWMAFWLDVPTNIPDGVYNTTVSLCGNLTFGLTSC